MRQGQWSMFFLLISVKESSQLRPKTTRAILNYEGVNQNKPSSSPQKTCTPDDPCYIVNQIYGYVHLNGNVKLYKNPNYCWGGAVG